MKLTLVTINYNSTEDTIRFLDSLRSQTDDQFDCIVIDNDSEPVYQQQLMAYTASYTRVLTVISSPQNRGFSGGNNLGIKRALEHGADWVALINNDTTVTPSFVGDLRSQLTSHPPAVVGVPINERGKTAYAGCITWNATSLPHLYRPVSREHATYVIGAALIVHREVFARSGYLDESYFLYFEDADFSLRARRAQFPIVHLAFPTIDHAVSRSTTSLGSPILLRYHIRNAIYFNRAHAPLTARVLLPVVLAWIAFKQVIKLFLGLEHAQSRALIAGIRDGVLGSMGRIRTRPSIAIECESLEDASWGVARQIRGFLTEFTQLPEVRAQYEVVAYFKSHIPDEPWIAHTNVRATLVRPFRWWPNSFSLYFFVFFPIRLWIDRPVVTIISNYMLPLLFRGKSIVMLTEDVWHEIRGHDLPIRYRLAYGIFATWAATRATRIMAITHASAERVAKLFGIRKERIFVNELAVAPSLAGAARSGEYVLYVGQGLPRRHLRETILAFGQITRHHPILTLLAVGPDKYQPPQIDELIARTNAELGRTAIKRSERLTDEELAAAYRGAKLFVYVSDMEAFGLPPLEALSYGVPSVLMDTPVHREIFGDHAFYTPDASPVSLAAALERGLADTQQRQAIIHASQSIVSRYTWEAHAKRMLHSIDDIA